jgi:hypothetical protein
MNAPIHLNFKLSANPQNTSDFREVAKNIFCGISTHNVTTYFRFDSNPNRILEACFARYHDCLEFWETLNERNVFMTSACFITVLLPFQEQ